MANAISRSWQITKLSFRVINQDKELLLFPILAAIFSILFIFSMIFPSFFGFIFGGQEVYGWIQYLMIFLTYLGLSVISTFFNVCVVYTTKVRFEGGNATFGESIRFAFSKIGLIFQWGIVSATIGLLFRILERIASRFGAIGQLVMKIVISLFGMAWSIVTIFVVPGMVYYGVRPFDAIKKSASTIKRVWGESLFRYFGLGVIEVLFFIGGVFAFFPVMILLSPLGIPGIMAGIFIVATYLVLVILVFGIANNVFNTALFVYSDTGRIPSGYSEEIMQNAFRQRVH